MLLYRSHDFVSLFPVYSICPKDDTGTAANQLLSKFFTAFLVATLINEAALFVGLENQTGGMTNTHLSQLN